MSDDKRRVIALVGVILLVGAVVSLWPRGAPVNERSARVHEYVSRATPRHVARQVRSDARNPAAATIHRRIQVKFEWLKEPAYNAAAGWNEGMTSWWKRIEADGQIYAPQWEALVVGYGQWIAYARQGDGFMYEEMNQEMHSVMYATRNFLERRALKVAKIAERKTRMNSKLRVEQVKRLVQMVEKHKPIEARGNAINLLAAANHLKLANAAEKQRNFHQAQAQAILTQFYAELTSARQNGMSPAQWHKIVHLRGQYVGQRNAETNQHYSYLVQYSHYVLYKYRFTW